MYPIFKSFNEIFHIANRQKVSKSEPQFISKRFFDEQYFITFLTTNAQKTIKIYVKQFVLKIQISIPLLLKYTHTERTKMKLRNRN